MVVSLSWRYSIIQLWDTLFGMKIVEIKLLHNNHSPSFMFLHLVSPVHFLRVAAKKAQKKTLLASFCIKITRFTSRMSQKQPTKNGARSMCWEGRWLGHVRTFGPWELPLRVLNLSWWQGGPFGGSKKYWMFFFFCEASYKVVMNHAYIFVAFIYTVYSLSRFRCLYHTEFCSNILFNHNKKLTSS